MLDRLFVYGTLLAPELRFALIGRTLESAPAGLAGYACYRVRRAPYPAIVATPGASTRGELLYDLSPSDLEKFDDFESTMYQRLVASVVDERGNAVDAYTYVIDDGSAYRLSDEPWDYTAFRLQHLHRYLGAL